MMSDLIRTELNEDTLIIRMIGRVDSNNSTAVGAEIDRARTESRAKNLLIDAEELEYVSSAGLRLILKLRKEYPAMEIHNVSSEVYDILDMTGFAEMIPVKKAYRKLSVDGCEVIGRGANGEVYRIDADTIVKVYFDPDCLPDIQRERELARKAFVLGIPTAIPYDVVRIGNTYGSVFELLNARSLAKIVAAEPEKIDEVVSMYVDLMKTIHSTEISPKDMPNEKDVVMKWVNDVKPHLTPETWEKLHALVEAVPENHHVMHGDYHLKNVMLQNGEALLIDMDTLCYGDPVFEFASLFNAYKGFYDGRPPVNGNTPIDIPYECGIEVLDKTLRAYFNTDDDAYIAEVTDKAALIGYTRLLRRTLRRCDMTDPIEQAAVEFYKKAITELVGKIDTLKL